MKTLLISTVLLLVPASAGEFTPSYQLTKPAASTEAGTDARFKILKPRLKRKPKQPIRNVGKLAVRGVALPFRIRCERES